MNHKSLKSLIHRRFTTAIILSGCLILTTGCGKAIAPNDNDAETTTQDSRSATNIDPASDKTSNEQIYEGLTSENTGSPTSTFEEENSQLNEVQTATAPTVSDQSKIEPGTTNDALIVPSTESTKLLPSDWVNGDVFIGVGSSVSGDPSFGEYRVYNNSGTFKETITAELTGLAAGCAFNPTGDKLYTTYFNQDRMVVFDANPPHSVLDIIDTATQGDNFPESIVFTANSDFYVGNAGFEAGVNTDVEKYDADGSFLQRFIVAVENRGSDWITLADDQRTLFYTSEGRRIMRYDVVSDIQLPDFAVLPVAASGFGPKAYALRLLPPGDGSGGLLVADSDNIKRLDGSGAVIQNYDVPKDVYAWFSVNLDPNGTSFWAGTFTFGLTGDARIGKVYRFNIETGAVEAGPIEVEPPLLIGGICVMGEPTPAVIPAEIALDPPTAENPTGTPHTVTATIQAGEMPLADMLVQFEITAGPNLGEVSDIGECIPNTDCTTDTSGQVSWTYTSNGDLGTDTVRACFTDTAGVERCTTAMKTWIDRTPPTVACMPTTNPSGNNVPPAGQNPKTGQNPDGFYELVGSDNVDSNVDIFIVDMGSGVIFGPFPSGTRINYTQANGAAPDQKKMSSDNGQADAVDWHIIGNGDLSLYAIDTSGNESEPVSCLVPPPPK